MSDSDATPGEVGSELPMILHTPEPWKGYRERAVDNMGWKWVLDSNTRGCMAVLDLPDISNWHKDRHPEWAAEQRKTLTEIDANFALIKAAPAMLRVLRDVEASLWQLCRDTDDESDCDVTPEMLHDWILQDLVKLQDVIAVATELEEPVPDDEL